MFCNNVTDLRQIICIKIPFRELVGAGFFLVVVERAFPLALSLICIRTIHTLFSSRLVQFFFFVCFVHLFFGLFVYRAVFIVAIVTLACRDLHFCTCGTDSCSNKKSENKMNENGTVSKCPSQKTKTSKVK